VSHGDLSHLAPEDRELYLALYAERNRVDRHEATTVQRARQAAQDAEAAASALTCIHPTPRSTAA
jgi:hypothetical protein